MESATETQRDQWLVEHQIRHIYDVFSTIPRNAQSVMLEIQRDSHIEYLTKGLKQLGPSFCVLDANRPWVCYWILHSIALLGESVDDTLECRTIDFLSRCQDPNGGYGGGPGQLPHLATTYAAVNTLITLGSEESFSSINRSKMYSFLKQMKDPSGAFRMHDGGEIDVRACYTAISVASVLNILDNELVQNLGDYILSCQTFEGGISGEPGSEAHGGYTFCGLATMILIDEVHRLDLPSLLDWVVYRQSGPECGFQGRTNKLVDGCYSFWQGGVCALSQRLRSVINKQLGLSDADEYSDTDTSETDADIVERNSEIGTDIQEGDPTQVPEICPTKVEAVGSHGISSDVKFQDIGYEFIKRHARMEPLFHSIALQQYIILCSQLQDGGFRDKPGKGRDFYHTCYCLSGLSLCQYAWSKNEDSAPLPRAVLGPYDNLLEPVHPLHNVVLSRYYDAHKYFFPMQDSP